MYLPFVLLWIFVHLPNCHGTYLFLATVRWIVNLMTLLTSLKNVMDWKCTPGSEIFTLWGRNKVRPLALINFLNIYFGYLREEINLKHLKLMTNWNLEGCQAGILMWKEIPTQKPRTEENENFHIRSSASSVGPDRIDDKQLDPVLKFWSASHKHLGNGGSSTVARWCPSWPGQHSLHVSWLSNLC